VASLALSRSIELPDVAQRVIREGELAAGCGGIVATTKLYPQITQMYADESRILVGNLSSLKIVRNPI
jgi:hypothetical protein